MGLRRVGFGVVHSLVDPGMSNSTPAIRLAGRLAAGRRGCGVNKSMESRYGWTLVALGGLMGCVAVGAMFSLAVFLEPMSVDTGWGRAGISSAMSLNFIAMGLGSFAWGMASDRWGARVVVLIGSAVLGLALVLASQAQTLGQFQLTFGILVGAATSAFFAPMIATVTGWFDRTCLARTPTRPGGLARLVGSGLVTRHARRRVRVRGHQRHPAVHAFALEHVAQVGLHRFRADPQLPRDLLVAQAARGPGDDFALARGQPRPVAGRV